MNPLTRRMENSRAWWNGEIERRNQSHADELKRNLAGLYFVTILTLSALQVLAGHL